MGEKLLVEGALLACTGAPEAVQELQKHSTSMKEQ